MPSWTSEHYKAIANWAKRNDLRIAMGSYPNAQFLTKDGESKSWDISELVKEYQTNKKDEARERRRLKVEEENRKPWHERYKQD